MLHYTDSPGYKGIASTPVWRFMASKPPGPHPEGAYFTTLRPGTRNLAIRLRIPKSKLEFAFEFSGDQGLRPIDGGRGEYVFWSAKDYEVDRIRQVYNGPSEDLK